MRRRLAPLALVLAVPWGLGGLVWFLEKSLIYYPDKILEATPAEYDLAYEDVFFPAPDGMELHGWWIPAKGGGAGRPVILWMHGNAGNISHRLHNARLLHDRLDVTLFLFDYREYGLSQGEVSEEGTYTDAEGAQAYVRGRPEVDAERLIYFGRSIGAAVAVELATRRAPAGLILESPMTSIPAMARAIFPWLPVRSLLSTQYDSLAKIGTIHLPLLVLHGTADEIVPFAQGQELFEAANEPKRFYAIDGARHNDTYFVGGEAYFRVWATFLEDLRKRGGR
ncbi:MAG: alpha/beta hydrolase [Candidatus Tectimicrobiota bacterium]